MPYQVSKTYFLRNPLLSFNFFKKVHEGEKIQDEHYFELFSDPIIKEAIYLASQDLFLQLQKWNDGLIEDMKEIEKLKISFLKYISRMSTRCTPFGLFASCGIGDFSKRPSAITLDPLPLFRKHSRLDMTFSIGYMEKMALNPEVESHLFFFPNSSLYKISGQYRYVEGTIGKTQKEYSLQSISRTWYLDQILEAAKGGEKLEALGQVLMEEGFGEEDSREYINSLVLNKVLVSSLEATVTGMPLWDRIGEEYLGGLISNSDYQRLADAVTKLRSTQQRIGEPVEELEKLRNFLIKIGPNLPSKHLIQTDFYSSYSESNLNNCLRKRIYQALTFLNRISEAQPNPYLLKFKQAFIRKYDQREVELVKVLDPETGIGYGRERNDFHPFLDDLMVPRTKKSAEKIRWTAFDDILLPLVLRAIKEGKQEIVLKKEDFPELQENWTDLPTTFSAMVEIYKKEGREEIFMDSAGGSSAANLIARFCSGHMDMNEHVQKLIALEESFEPEKIYAEVVHLPQVRTGNVLTRPSFRKYEIPYLAQSGVSEECQINITDLLLSVKGDRILLRSKKHDKEVIPYQTNAHNFRADALPLYHFLCDMQTQNLRSHLGFQWNRIFRKFDFLPRIKYQDIIVSKARWQLNKETIIPFYKETENLLPVITSWRSELKLPKYAVLVVEDHKLVIDFENLDSIKMFLSEVRKKNKIILEEFLFDTDEGIVRRNGETYCNQFVVSFCKKHNGF